MNILQQIIRDTRALVEKRKADLPQSCLERHPALTAPSLDLVRAISGDRLSIIAEIKRASPSRGIIRAEYQVADIARQYKLAGASVLSVLTEPFHFKSSLEDLKEARNTVDLPLLRKDFIVDPYQLYEARIHGADAVLLIAAVLDRHQLFDLHQTAEALGLSCLVEVYEEQELDKIDFDQVKVLGVNNRDLRTFKVDINHSLRIFKKVPESVVRVSESGLQRASDLAYLEQQGVDAVLIGETFMRAHQPGEMLRKILHETRALAQNMTRLRLVV